MNKKVIEAFHNHLDNCSQCRNNPFDLCPTGAKLIVKIQKPAEKK
jgi:predicted anti-sigma-YlaC factor YlaD